MDIDRELAETYLCWLKDGRVIPNRARLDHKEEVRWAEAEYRTFEANVSRVIEWIESGAGRLLPQRAKEILAEEWEEAKKRLSQRSH